MQVYLTDVSMQLILTALLIFIYYLFTKYDVNEIINKLSTFVKKTRLDKFIMLLLSASLIATSKYYLQILDWSDFNINFDLAVFYGLFNMLFSDPISHILDRFKLNITLEELFFSPPCDIDGNVPKNNPLIFQKGPAENHRPLNGGVAPNGIIQTEEWINARRSLLENRIRGDRAFLLDLENTLDNTRDRVWVNDLRQQCQALSARIQVLQQELDSYNR